MTELRRGPQYDLAVFVTHPIQYYSPIFRELSKRIRVRVFYCHDLQPSERLATGIGAAFSWDVPLLDGYEWEFLRNTSAKPSVHRYFGCNTPDCHAIIASGRYRAVMVAGWQVYSYCQAMMAAQRSGVRLMVRGDSQMANKRPLLIRAAKSVVYGIVASRIDAFLSVGVRSAEYFAYYGADPCKIYSVPHCVDNEWWLAKAVAARQNERLLREKWGLPAGPTTFVFVGRLVESKRPLDLLRAFMKAKASADMTLLFVGEGPLRGALEEVAGSDPAVRFVGFQNQGTLPELYSLSHALVLPSDSETWGLVVNEAFASGIPAIVSNECGCSPDLIDDGKTGFSFPAGDVGLLAARLDEFHRLRRTGLDFSPHLSEKMRIYSVDSAVEGICAAARGEGR